MSMKSRIKILSRAEKALKELERISANAEEPGTLRVGLPKGSGDYPDGTSVVMVGATHEFGSAKRNIPQRSFLRSTMQEKRRAYKSIFRKIGKNILTGKSTADKELNKLGLLVQTDVREKITDIKEPALVSRDGNPLVDTGHLRQSINYEVS